jgi:hypothetical protein
VTRSFGEFKEIVETPEPSVRIVSERKTGLDHPRRLLRTNKSAPTRRGGCCRLSETAEVVTVPENPANRVVFDNVTALVLRPSSVRLCSSSLKWVRLIKEPERIIRSRVSCLETPSSSRATRLLSK